MTTLATDPAASTPDPRRPLASLSSSSPADALARIRIVLVEASHPGNVGAVARAMKVMGLSALTLVAPRRPDVLVDPEARAFASGAVDVLDGARVVATLDEALADTVDAIALSARDRVHAPPAATLAEAATRALDDASRGRGDVAFVFGSERYGLSNDDVLRCRSRCRIETSEVYGSLNLAQAVQLVAYRCRLAALDRVHAGALDAPPPASHAEQEALFAHLERGLVAIGFLDPDAPKKLMPRVRRLFARARLEHDEVQWLRGIAKAMLEAGR